MHIEPNFKQFQKELKRGNAVPVCLKLPADLETPVSIFLKLARKKDKSFLLESVELEEQLGRFSLIGMDPAVLLRHEKGVSKISKNGKTESLHQSILTSIKGLLSEYHLKTRLKLPSLVGGLVGFMGYELVQEFEDIKLSSKNGLSLPDSILMLPTNLIIFDHIKHELKLIHLVVNQKFRSTKQNYQKAKRELMRMKSLLDRPVVVNRTTPPARKIKMNSNLSKAEFESLVKRAKEHIRAGDCIQIVLSQRFALGRVSDDFQIYRSLRSLNPSPYMFYLKYNNFSLVGSSPEMLVKKTGLIAETRPIAGTRPRGRDKQEDLMNEASLRASKKEMAEHLMLVDLGRNDLGRVSDPKSVRVEDFAQVERYSHVMHLVSEVKSILKKNKSALDLLQASFPAGTVTGAPKIKAMQIIDQLEKDRRGPYAGAFGYFSLNGDMDMCITIRTIIVHDKKAYVQAGAGIVNDSIPKKEYQETINKAKALMQAVNSGENFSCCS